MTTLEKKIFRVILGLFTVDSDTELSKQEEGEKKKKKQRQFQELKVTDYF